MNMAAFVGGLTARWRGLSLLARFAIAGAAGVVIIGSMYLIRNAGSASQEEAPHYRAVTLASVADLENDSTPLPLIGSVQSVSEAEIRTQASGPIRHLYYKLGSYVPSGGIIAEIENASERATLLQSQGAYEAAQAGVQKNTKLFSESKRSALDTIKSVYSSNDDLIRSKLDTVFSNPQSPNPLFVLSVTDQSLLNKAQSDRVQIGLILASEATRAATLTEESDLKAEISKATDETRQIKSFIDDVSTLLNLSITSATYPQSSISAFITTASAARASASGSLASLTTAAQSLINTQTTGDTPEEASSAAASLKQAQASLDSAKAALEKTIIRAPIAGTINSLSINLGDFVTAAQQVAVVSNNGALEIVAHITPEDRSTMSVGTKVKIENRYDGWISFIAPAVDPTTKKIEIKIGFSGASGNLANGQSVHIDVERTGKALGGHSDSGASALPISTIKIQPDGPVVFTVDENQKLIAHKVTTGDLIGGKIQVLTGVNDDMQLVTDARGLKDGQQVEVQ